MAVIPFYGADDPAMFALERRAMDRDGLVIDALDRVLPAGRVVDVGAGDGFTAERLRSGRDIVALEPERGMIARAAPLAWVQGDAEHLPFRSATFDAAYATWAYFFSRDWDPTPGIAELDRVVVRGGPLAIVDNLGGDGFAAMAEADISADPSFWLDQGFEVSVIDTAFRFEDLRDAQALLGFFFGDAGRRGASTEVGFRVGLFSRASRGA
ncbi:MAG: class I SAM-dependent methyltransferase [Actinomycetota bacterium]|nr:class I SAM-dependent methyltransferase [Actinomycetota bacterium]